MQGNTSFNEHNRILQQMESLQGRFEEISIRITLPEVISDGTLFQKLMREHSELSEMAEFAQGYLSLTRQIEQAREMLELPDMRDIAEEELQELEPRLEDMIQEARLMLLPKDPDDYRNALVEVRASAGGDEAGLFGYELVRMYQHYAESKGFKVEVDDGGGTEIGGIKEAVLMIQGKGVFSKFKYESGVHRVQRVPVTESGGRIHTSTCTVAVLPEAEDVEVVVNPGDLRIDTYRASGAGGQHVNRTDSAVRITHIPTGVVVQSQDQRSQIQNRERAMRVLRSRLYELQREQAVGEYADRRKSQVGTGDRSERIRTYNYPQGRVTDHRIGLTLYRLTEVLSGDLDEIVDALTLHEQTELLKQQS